MKPIVPAIRPLNISSPENTKNNGDNVSNNTSVNRSVIKITKLNQDQILKEESLYRNKFYTLYDEGKIIGEGCSAVVKECTEKKTGQERAVKIFKSDDMEKLLLVATKEY